MAGAWQGIYGLRSRKICKALPRSLSAQAPPCSRGALSSSVLSSPTICWRFDEPKARLFLTSSAETQTGRKRIRERES